MFQNRLSKTDVSEQVVQNSVYPCATIAEGRIELFSQLFLNLYFRMIPVLYFKTVNVQSVVFHIYCFPSVYEILET
jgi:hypothetical protein